MAVGIFSLLGVAAAMPPFVENLLKATGGVDGISTAEWNAMSFFQRVRVYNFQMEYLVLATIAAYLLTHFWGVARNKERVERFMNGVRPVLAEEFAEVGCNKTQEVIKDSNARYTTYATGRVNIASLTARMHLVDRHNVILSILGIVIPNFRSIEGLTDQVDVEIVPMDPTAIEPAIFAIVNKSVIREVRDSKYYLSLCRTTESPKLPQELCFMAEHKDITDALFTPELEAAVKEASSLVEYIAVTDQGSDAPEKVTDITPKVRVFASFGYPKDADEEAKLGRVMEATIGLVDHLVNKKPLRVEVARKIKASREEAIMRIKRKEEQVRLDEIEARKAEERRTADRALDKLSEKEQRKLLKKQQEKEQRKMQKKQSTRMR